MRWLRLAAALLATVASLGLADAADDWVPVRETSLVVAPGSPLDFSTILPNAPIGADNHLAVDAAGHLAFSGSPDRPARLLCASLAWSPASGGFPDHADADLYARQLAMHGYNIARFHFVDASLMNGRAADFDFDPETLDRFRYLMAALKRNGISWIMDGMTSSRGAYGGYDDRWDYTGTLKRDIYTDDRVVQHWIELQKRLLGTVNPYTGMAPLQDPALALIVLVNENGLEFSSFLYDRPGQPPYPASLEPGFNAWLKRHYGTTAALARAWAGALPAGQTIEAANVALPSSRRERSPRMRDTQAYFVELERAMAARLTTALRQLGYLGLVSDYNNWTTVQTALSREALPVVTLNGYEGFVSSYDPGARVEQTSSLGNGAEYFRKLAAARWLGRPLVVTEYDQLFWNRYRYEAGLVFPAYAALQGWDAICRHAQGPIVLRYGENFPQKHNIYPYAIALDPVARAGETLAALLFRRGDVATAATTVPFAMRGDADLTDGIETYEPSRLTALALIARIGLAPAALADKAPVSVGQPRTTARIDAIIAALRHEGAIAAANATNLDRGIYQSATGELQMDTAGLSATVATSHTDAMAFARLTAPLAAGALAVSQATTSALVSASALDGRDISDSRRLLLIFATDARNSGMRFTDATATTVTDYGHLPVLIRRGQISFTLAGRGHWTIAPVGLDGTVHAIVASGDGPVDTTLSNVGPAGPTTYFLISR